MMKSLLLEGMLFSTSLPLSLNQLWGPTDTDTESARLHRPIGFDVEWKPQFAKGGAENPIALVQLADRHRILLIHVFMMRGRCMLGLPVIFYADQETD